MHTLLGIDGGGTKTVALLTDMQGRTLSRAVGGPMNVQRMTDDELQSVLYPLFGELFAAMDPTPFVLSALGAGFAGASAIPSHTPLRQLLEAALAAAVCERPVTLAPSLPMAIHHDMVIALAAGSSTRNGIVVIAGTGSSVYGERDAASVRVGGWGPAFGDEGSGYAIGHQALRSVMQVYDGRLPASVLAEAICHAWQCAAPPELLMVWRARQPTVAEVAQLTPVVAAAAEEGDWLARAILQDAAAELARCVVTAVTQLDLGDDPFPLIMSGGVLHHVPLVAEELIAQVAAAAPGVAPRVLDIEPVNGAIHIARQLLR